MRLPNWNKWIVFAIILRFPYWCKRHFNEKETQQREHFLCKLARYECQDAFYTSKITKHNTDINLTPSPPIQYNKGDN